MTKISGPRDRVIDDLFRNCCEAAKVVFEREGHFYSKLHLIFKDGSMAILGGGSMHEMIEEARKLSNDGLLAVFGIAEAWSVFRHAEDPDLETVNPSEASDRQEVLHAFLETREGRRLLVTWNIIRRDEAGWPSLGEPETNTTGPGMKFGGRCVGIFPIFHGASIH